MALLVQKYGGSSVGSIDKIKVVAAKVAAAKRAGNDVIVVVSAMAGETNRLIALAQEISPIPDERERDVLIATGEQVTVGLLAIVLQSMGINARSWQGWQLPILTSDAHGSARIMEINGAEIIRRFAEQKEVAVVAGFQGID